MEELVESILDYIRADYTDYAIMINVYKYDGIIREKIIEYKFQDKSYLYKTFAKMIL